MWLIQVYIPFDGTLDRRGLSERVVRRRLEREGWTVWRGGIIGIEKRDEVYPNVRRKYSLLSSLLDRHRPGIRSTLEYWCHVHHGLPDFIAFRLGKFKFVECKLGYEQLSMRQRRCIARLKALDFDVEIHKLAEPQTRARLAHYDVVNGEKVVYEKQLMLKKRW